MTTATQKIPTGYKQTDAGVIPMDWNVISYDEAFKFLRTAQYSRDQLGKGQVSYVHYGDIHTKWNHFVDLEQSLPTIEDDKVNNYSLIEDGDLIVADASEDYEGIGKSVEVKNIKTKRAISGLHTFLLRDKGNFFVKGFRGYIHTNPLVKASMDRLATGLKVYGVSKSNLKLIQIPQPPRPEQTAIAVALSDIADLISKLELLVHKKNSIKQGVMHELLNGKRRLAGFNGKWKTKKLGDLLDYEQPTPYLVKSTDYSDNNIVPVLTAGKTFILGYTAEDTGIFKNLPAIIFDDFTTATKYVDFPFKAKSSAMKMLVPKTKDVSLKFVYAKMQLIDFKLGDHKRYWISEYQNIEIETPEPNEQAAIAALLSDMDAEIEKLESQLTKYRDLKQGMMQSLLTGKIRLLAK